MRILLLVSLSGFVATTVAIAAPIAGSGAATSAIRPGGAVIGSQSDGMRFTDALRRQRAMDALMRESRQLQRSDGGTLTPAHHVWLETRLNQIMAGHD
jgi:hypothetical protein